MVRFSENKFQPRYFALRNNESIIWIWKTIKCGDLLPPAGQNPQGCELKAALTSPPSSPSPSSSESCSTLQGRRNALQGIPDQTWRWERRPCAWSPPPPPPRPERCSSSPPTPPSPPPPSPFPPSSRRGSEDILLPNSFSSLPAIWGEIFSSWFSHLVVFLSRTLFVWHSLWFADKLSQCWEQNPLRYNLLSRSIDEVRSSGSSSSLSCSPPESKNISPLPGPVAEL